MRLIIEVDNDAELEQARSFLASLSLQSAEISDSRLKSRRDFVKRYRENQVSLDEIPSREERNAR
ncbi:MAG: hypothetical protein F6K45_11990 [Kamptonema sp. SIO1D9]|nr:hypothetical protein [Kamptonema sp. SIO1D9]